jgi:GNAT superfamily N-acetyltransferase
MMDEKDEPILDVSYSPEESDIAAIGQGILAYTLEQIGQTSFHRCCITIRDGTGLLLGGMFGDIRWGWLHLKALWVAPQRRGRGLGARILLAAEDEARKNGCRAVWLTTESFQAEPFYARFGYEVFARLEDYPPGQERVFMRKLL